MSPDLPSELEFAHQLFELVDDDENLYAKKAKHHRANLDAVIRLLAIEPHSREDFIAAIGRYPRDQLNQLRARGLVTSGDGQGRKNRLTFRGLRFADWKGLVKLDYQTARVVWGWGIDYYLRDGKSRYS